MDRIDLPQGTLDLLILKTLGLEPQHGWAISERIKQISPIWKHEHFEGGEVWIEGATADPLDEIAQNAAFERACS